MVIFVCIKVWINYYVFNYWWNGYVLIFLRFYGNIIVNFNVYDKLWYGVVWIVFLNFVILNKNIFIIIIIYICLERGNWKKYLELV